jgi:cysteinyl-tRNA synthetase
MQTDKYTKFDDEGIPTNDPKGLEISKEIRNKIKKEFLKHQENHKKWLEKNSESNVK